MAATKKSATNDTKPKPGGTGKRPAIKTEHHPEATITIDRRAAQSHRREGDRRGHHAPVNKEHRTVERRAKTNRRRQIDPTTCERDYTQDEIEFMGAMDNYKRRSGRMFPTCSEVLEVLKSLGYEKRAMTDGAALPPGVPVAISATPMPSPAFVGG